MEEVFVKFYVLASLWFWAGMLLSEPLRRAFAEMHRRLLKRICDATCGQVINMKRKAVQLVEEQKEKLQIRVARSLISKELLDDLTHKNLIAAIARAKQMDQYSPGLYYEDMVKIVQLASGKSLDSEAKETAVVKSFEICNTDLFRDIMNKVPRAQERILLTLDKLEGNPPYDSILNQEYRKFIRE